MALRAKMQYDQYATIEKFDCRRKWDIDINGIGILYGNL